MSNTVATTKPAKDAGQKNQTYLTKANEDIVTPLGLLRYAWLDKPKVDKTFDKVQYEAVLSFDPANPEWAALKTRLEAMFRGYLKESGQDPKIELDAFKTDPEDPTRTIVRFYSKANEGDPVFSQILDKSLNKTDTPWKGSTVRIAFGVAGWKSKRLGTGLSLYLNGVLVEDSVGGTRKKDARGAFAAYADPSASAKGAFAASQTPSEGVPDATEVA